MLVGCKEDKQGVEQPTTAIDIAEDHAQLSTVSGEFLYLADAAVINTGRKVYGVTINEKMQELNEKVQQYKNNDYDMVPVRVRGTIERKPENEEGWEEVVTIKEIISVTPPKDTQEPIIIK